MEQLLTKLKNRGTKAAGLGDRFIHDYQLVPKIIQFWHELNTLAHQRSLHVP
jgi:hypothetical protein